MQTSAFVRCTPCPWLPQVVCIANSSYCTVGHSHLHMCRAVAVQHPVTPRRMAGCDCYWGCRSASNRAAWLIFASLILATVVLWGTGVSKLVPCSRARTACDTAATLYTSNTTAEKSLPLRRQCVEDLKVCMKLPIVLIGCGFGTAVAAVVLSFYFCCCATRPAAHEQGQMQQGYLYPPQYKVRIKFTACPLEHQ